MNNTVNMTGSEMQCVEGFRMMLQGMSLVFGTMAGSLGNTAITIPAEADKPAKEASPEMAAKPTTETVKAAAPAQAETNAPAPAETKAETSVPEGKPVTRKDVERAMGAKIKELARKGEGPDAIGAVFPKFHNAQCISDLDVTDYPAFLEELAKL